MNWQVYIRHPNGEEKALCSYRDCEAALKRIQAIYSQSHPMQVGYVIRAIY